MTIVSASPGSSGAQPAVAPPWRPPVGTSWQWQLEGTLDLSVAADVYDIDLFDARADDVRSLHGQGRRVVCYISAGTWERWRPDAADFPGRVRGGRVEGWAGERWLDIRRLDVLKPIMAARLDLCKEKGFDGVEVDNVDGYSNRTGFPLQRSQQLRYNRWLASAAHSRGLSIALKNSAEQVLELVDDFDFAIVEECFARRECEAFSPFIQRGKAVFQAEYDLSAATVCPESQRLQFSAILKRPLLDSFREACA